MIRFWTFTAVTAALATAVSATIALADPLGGISPRGGYGVPVPYGPGFGQGVVIGRTDGCRNYNCAPGNFQNRPYERRYYRNYFDVPTPRYSGPGAIGGNRALGGAHTTRTLPPAGTAAGEHRDWCADRYRSYRASDNSWKPVDGARKQCVSPFS